MSLLSWRDLVVGYAESMRFVLAGGAGIAYAVPREMMRREGGGR